MGMGTWNGISVVFLTTVMGGAAAFGLSYFLIWLLNISNFEGGSGYFTLFVIIIGVVGGFFVGVIAALTLGSSFIQVQLRAAGIVVALTIIAGVVVTLAKVFEDKGPKLEGDSIRLEVELKCPRDWKPDNALKAGHGGCFLQKCPEDGPIETNPIVSGRLSWDNTPAPGEPWRSPARSRLKRRLVRATWSSIPAKVWRSRSRSRCRAIRARSSSNGARGAARVSCLRKGPQSRQRASRSASVFTRSRTIARQIRPRRKRSRRSAKRRLPPCRRLRQSRTGFRSTKTSGRPPRI